MHKALLGSFLSSWRRILLGMNGLFEAGDEWWLEDGCLAILGDADLLSLLTDPRSPILEHI